jgi:OmpA family protein
MADCRSAWVALRSDGFPAIIGRTVGDRNWLQDAAMKSPTFATRTLIAGLLGAAAATSGAQQAAPAAVPSPAASVGLFVYPAKNQDAAQQSTDESQCYDWSRTQNGFDPAAPAAAAAPAQPAEAEKQGPGGERVKGAVRGAAAGAVIGEVADNDAGRGAEIGAATGVLAGGRQARQNRRTQEEKAVETTKANEEAAKAAQQQKVDTFKRGMSACLEARGYSVK